MQTKLKSALFTVLIGFAVVTLLSSCDKSMDEPMALPEKSDTFDQKELSTLRSSSSLGNFEFSPEAGSANETQFFFELTSTEPLVANNQVSLYVIFYPPQGGTFPVQMNKSVFGSTVRAVLYRNLQQVGTYKFKCGFSVNGGSVVPFTDEESIIVTSLTDDYPWPNASSSDRDTWGFYKRWCTSWVAWKVNQMWNTSADFFNTMFGSSDDNKLGNASHWKQVLEQNGYESDLNPKIGDIAWWSSNHVAFVSRVVDDDTVEITEYNNPPANKPLAFHTRLLYRDGEQGHRFPDAFIHVQEKK